MTTDQVRKLTKIFTYCQLLINEIDDKGTAKNETTLNIFNKCDDLQNDLIEIVDQFYENKNVSRSTKFLEIQEKVDYIMRKNIK